MESKNKIALSHRNTLYRNTAHRNTAHRNTVILAGLLTACAALPANLPGLINAARADANGSTMEMSGIETLRVPRGGRLTLPLTNVTRIVPADEDIVRGRFENGRAIVEGISPGVTLIAVQQGTGSSATLLQYEVEVLDSSEPISPIDEATPLTGSITPPPDISTLPPVGPAIVPDIPTATEPQLTVSLGVAPAEDNPAQALFTITYGNAGAKADDVVLRYALDDMVSYVTGSATNNGKYDAARRELSWKLGDLDAGVTGQTVAFRIAPLESTTEKFFSVATIEEDDGVLVKSNTIEYSFVPTPLLTVFALPDRVIEGRSAAPFMDVRGTEYQTAIDRLEKIGVLEGKTKRRFNPAAKTQRSEYAVMILRALNLRDLRDAAAIKFVLSRRATVKLDIRNSDGRVVRILKNESFDKGEHTAIWDGRTSTGQAAPGRYSYVCSARDAKGMTTELRGYIHVIPQTPLQPSGMPSFTDIRPTAWYAGYIALAEKQGLVVGYPNKQFRPLWPINRVEATAVVVRAMGLEDIAKRVGKKEAGFLDDYIIPNWAKGYVYVASTLAKTNTGKLIVGYPNNMYMPLNPMRRDDAALIVQRLVDKETNRKLYVSGQMVPGTTFTLNGRNVQPADDGSFSFVLEQNNADPMTVAVMDSRLMPAWSN